MKKLSILALIAMTVTMGFFLISYNISNRLISEKKGSRIDGKIIKDMEEYVRDNSVSTRDTDALYEWCKENPKVDIEVFVDGELVFSSLYDSQKSDHSIMESRQEKKYTSSIQFQDQRADVVFYGLSSLYDRITATEVMISIFLFFVIIFLGIRNEVNYVRTLNDEIHALEGGDLSREITIKGSDEVAMLAESVDEFRRSMKEHLTKIEKLEKSNRQIAAEIAHDLRTPLTSLIMYLDFALDDLGDREPSAAEYVERAKERSVRLKDLMDVSFDYMTMPDYFLKEKQLMPAYEVLSGFLVDGMTMLEGEGFYVRSDIIYGHSKILVQRDALGRVFSNLLSNASKYAERDKEVYICCREKEKWVELRFVNLVRKFNGEKPKGTGFGSRIVKRLMQEMNGEYFAEEKDGKYTTILRFVKA